MATRVSIYDVAGGGHVIVAHDPNADPQAVSRAMRALGVSLPHFVVVRGAPAGAPDQGGRGERPERRGPTPGGPAAVWMNPESFGSWRGDGSVPPGGPVSPGAERAPPGEDDEDARRGEAA